jgi:hypothetical protein
MRLPDRYDTVLRLKFDDPELAKLEVRLRQSYGLVDSGGELVAIDLDAIRAGQAKPEDLQRLRALVADFSGALVSWNLEDDNGQPVGTDVHTVRSLDLLFVLTLVDAFMRALTDIAADAAQLDETNLPMDILQ